MASLSNHVYRYGFGFRPRIGERLSVSSIVVYLSEADPPMAERITD